VPVANDQVLEFELVRPPFPNQPIRVEVEPMALSSEEDFALFQELSEANDCPIYVSPRELYQLLETILECALTVLPGIRMTIMKVNMPGGLRLPERLVTDDVFLVQNVDVVFEECRCREISCLALMHDVRRFPIEAGRNRIKLKYARAAGGADAARQLTDALAPLGLISIKHPIGRS
jgi:hypothetical protein